MIVKATSMAIQQHPDVNSSWQGDSIRYNEHVHIGVAMAVEDGLLVPVVRFANTKRLSQIATEVKEFGSHCKSKKLAPEDSMEILSQFQTLACLISKNLQLSSTHLMLVY